MLTAQQQAVVACASNLKRGEILKVEACAGSGKTATLVEIARANPQTRFLYLAFNKAIVQEAKTRFPPNVKIFTTHGLAYMWYRYTYGSERLHTISPGFKAIELQSLLPKASPKELNQALTAFRQFCQSGHSKVPDAAAAVWEAVQDGRLPLTHDFYLKLWQLHGKPRFRNHDCVMLDEAQDTNAVTLALFLDNDCSKIVVGDRHQAIYGFRGAVNALATLKADYNLHLSYSFRSTQAILDRANYFLQRYATDRANLHAMISKADPTRLPGGQAILARTNAQLIKQLAEATEHGRGQYRLLRTAESIFSLPLSVLALQQGKLDAIRPECAWLKRFKNAGALTDYAEDIADTELKSCLNLIHEWGPQLPTLYPQAQHLYGNQQATIDLATAHCAKGLEWQQVTLCRDFMDLKEEFKQLKGKQKGARLNPEQFEQELNLYYVAVTRAGSMLTDFSPNNRTFVRRRTKC
ncbi:MAG: UvrD-helicase domain-containing protein [Candidatus Anaerobiospirillum merdipullorum]|uniref:DNA 3'-5' helicase n=1 Tax=Candidatus Anaerobiospirillum merdipullorum TaxID=2838450 RepID=A0A9E2NTB6_9GAMM|nr:UvrD-helicase domain-containing protein [Candidatus Anaerobiospirillum merdipullorum]